jgi:Holliday junction resolvase RusA-like endonuclease
MIFLFFSNAAKKNKNKKNTLSPVSARYKTADINSVQKQKTPLNKLGFPITITIIFFVLHYLV